MIFLSRIFPGSFVGSANASVATVSATVVEQSFNAPVLVSPANNATTNTSRPTFSWLRPSPVPSNPLNHYDFYLDGAVFAASLSDSLTSVDFYFYSATASAGTFYLTLKTDLAQGTHTWKVTAYNDGGTSAASETRTFYLDSVFPFISVTNVDTRTLTWTTANPATIPAIQYRYLTVTTPSPIVKGGVEASSNFQIILVCPSNIPTTCTNKTYSGNIPSGLWQYTLGPLSTGYTYTVKASATDAAGNSTLFPDFYLTYGTLATPLVTPKPRPTTVTPTPVATVSGTPTTFPTLPLPSTILTPAPELLAVITPAPPEYGPPPSPTPPPAKTKFVFNPIDLFYNFLIVLIILGLPLHLFMTTYGAATPLGFIPKFLFILAYPFLRNKKYQTTPFSFITFFVADKLEHPWQRVVSDIQGFYTLKSPIPENIFIILTAFGKTWKDNLFKGTIIPISCLFPLPVKLLTTHSHLQKLLYDHKLIPLIIACLTSITAFIIKPSYPIMIYVYFSLQYLFSQYIYPKL